MTTAQAIMAGLAVMLLAAASGFFPQPLLAGLGEGAPARRAGLRLGLWAGLAGLATLSAAAAVFPWQIALGLALLATVLAAMAAVDLAHLVIPDFYVVAIAALALVGPLARPLPEALAGAALGGGLLWVVRTAYARLRGVEGLGFGDVKLLAALGALAGPRDVLWIVVGGAVVGMGLVLLRRRGSDPMTAFGAAVAVPAMAAVAIARLAP